jgi:hypothetical protein
MLVTVIAARNVPVDAATVVDCVAVAATSVVAVPRVRIRSTPKPRRATPILNAYTWAPAPKPKARCGTRIAVVIGG